jgi:hypothetical protein
MKDENNWFFRSFFMYKGYTLQIFLEGQLRNDGNIVSNIFVPDIVFGSYLEIKLESFQK